MQVVPSLRRERILRLARRILEAPRPDGAFRVVHFSIQSDHLHLIVEAEDKAALSSGVRSLVIRFAKRLNALLRRPRGRVWADRYHRRDLRTPREVRNALVYVLCNAKKHGRFPADAPVLDVFSSASWFKGWAPGLHVLRALPEDPPSVQPPASWLLREGWRARHGPLDPRAAPSPTRSAPRGPTRRPARRGARGAAAS